MISVTWLSRMSRLLSSMTTGPGVMMGESDPPDVLGEHLSPISQGRFCFILFSFFHEFLFFSILWTVTLDRMISTMRMTS